MNVLLTGGAGFIGSNIADSYISKGYGVIIIDNLHSGCEENLNKNCKFIKADIFSDDLNNLLDGIEINAINHHAANIDLRKSVSDPLYDAKININGTISILEFARKRKINKIIFASSGGSVYGDQQYFPADENHKPNPQTPYAISKYAAEQYLRFYGKFFGINYIILRYSNVFGERQGLTGEAGVISIFIKKMLAGEQPLIFGNGLNTRDFLYVKDAVEANVKALEYNGSATLNISSGNETNINDLYDKVKQFTNFKKNRIHAVPIEREQERSVLSNKEAKNILNWEPAFTLDKGLKKTCEWYMGNRK